MRRVRTTMLAALLCLVFTGTAAAQTPALMWGKQFNGGTFPAVYALAVRASKLWVGGAYTTSIDLGGASYASPQNSYLAQFTSDGVYQWSHAFSIGNGAINAMGADLSDNIYITGFFSGTVDFGAGGLTALGSNDIFLAKFNSTGVHQWSKRFGDAANDAGLALVIDSGNNVIIGGRIGGTTDFGGGPLITAGGSDAFIAKFNSSGTHIWSKKFGDVSSQEVDALASVNGDVYATGTYFGTINLGGLDLPSAGLSDIYLARFNSSAAHQWSKNFGDASSQDAIDVDADLSGVYLLSNFQGAVNFGGGSLSSAGSQDVAVARFSTAGVHTWSKRFGDADIQSATGLDMAGSTLVVTGYFEGSISFSASHPLFAGSSGADVFLARLLAVDGSEMWSQRFGNNFNSDYGFDAVTDGSWTYIGGRFDKDIELGYDGSLSSPDHTAEAFLAKFAALDAEPVIRAVSDVGNDQGGKVRINFTGAAYDAVITPLPIRNYEIYLRDDPLGAGTARGASIAAGTWILAGEAPPHAIGNYYTLAFTQQDSTLATGMHESFFKVRATTDDPSLYYDSLIMSGYSLDNLAPSVPSNFVIDNQELSWRAPADADIAFYTVYGSAGAFATAELIDYTGATRLDVSAHAFAHYFVTATDRAGNEGRPASLDGSRPGAMAAPHTLSVSAYPNPFNPTTTIRYTLPAAGRVHVDVFDALGVHVRSLIDRQATAGAFVTEWNGRDDAGRVAASGIYFARIEHSGSTRTYKLVMLK